MEFEISVVLIRVRFSPSRASPRARVSDSRDAEPEKLSVANVWTRKVLGARLQARDGSLPRQRAMDCKPGAVLVVVVCLCLRL